MTMNTKEPDKYCTLKIPLQNLIKPNIENTLMDAIVRTNKLIIHVYQFLRLWILHKYHNSEIIPVITKGIILICFKSLMKPTKRGQRPTGKQLIIFNEFNKQKQLRGCLNRFIEA